MHTKIALISNEKTIAGFEIAGVADCPETKTVFCLDQSAGKEEILSIFLSLNAREDIGIIFINENFAELISNEIHEHQKAVPSVLAIPFRL